MKRFYWEDSLEGKTVRWAGQLWRFEKGVPRLQGIADMAPEDWLWVSLPDASRMFDLRQKFLREAIAKSRIRTKRLEGAAGPGQPVVYLRYADVAKLRPAKRRRRTKSVRAQAITGAVKFINGTAVPVVPTEAV